MAGIIVKWALSIIITTSLASTAHAEADILILDRTVHGCVAGSCSPEVLAAQEAGYTVDLVSTEAFLQMTAEDFKQYKALVFGTRGQWTASSDYDGLIENPAWLEAVTGKFIVSLSDAAANSAELAESAGYARSYVENGGTALIRWGINQAVSQSGPGVFLSINPGHCDRTPLVFQTIDPLFHIALAGYPRKAGQLEYDHHCSKCPEGPSLAVSVAEA